jgi:hypothetical protein
LRQLIEDAPPEGCGGVLVGERSSRGRRPQEVGGVKAGPGEVAQPFCQLRKEWVCVDARDFCGKQLPPLPVCVGVRGGGESLVELLLEGSGGVAELGWPGGPQVARADLGGGPPYLYLADQLRRHWSMTQSRPGRRICFGFEADLLGELSNKL